MGRLTYHTQGEGVNIKDDHLKSHGVNGALYICLCKLCEYENTGLTPQEVSDIIRTCPVHIGSEFAGYSVFALSDTVCIAERIGKLGFDDFVVWHIDDYTNGVWGGVYFENRQEALTHFADII